MHDRVLQMKEVLREVIANFIIQESNRDSLITVSNINMSRDFKRATIYVTVLPREKEEEVLAFLQRKRDDLRSAIMKNTNTRRVPFFDFSVDYGEVNRQRIEEISIQEGVSQEE
ncbi:MAG: ribosome-binding factor A [Flavobacteriaceae bacterium]|jgi:ribosome-binding factor A